MAYPLTAAQAHLGELVAETRQSHRPVTICEHGQPVAALAAHLADKAAGRAGISLDARVSGDRERPLQRRTPVDRI